MLALPLLPLLVLPSLSLPFLSLHFFTPTLPQALAAPTDRHPRGPITLPLRYTPEPAERLRRTRRSQHNGINSAPLHSFATQYSITMDIGTPPQPLELMFDTGSPALWVMDGCTTPQCANSTLFDSSSSSSLTRSKESWGMIYGAGEVSGSVAGEVIGIGAMRARTVMGLAGHTDSWGHTASGLAGFGPPSDYSIPPWWVGVIDTWPEKRFGLFVGQTADWLSPIPLNTTVRGAGSVTLGGVDPSLFEGELKGTEANLTKWWSVGIDGVRINGADIDIAVGLENTSFGKVGGRPSAMLDTGLSGLVGPIRAVEKIYAAIPGAFTVDGETYFLPLLPHTLEFCFAGDCWPSTLVDVAECRGRDDMLSWFPQQVSLSNREADQWCTGTLLGSDEAGTEFPQWALGDAFLQHNYVAHQLEPPEVQVGRLSDTARGMVKEANIALNRLLGG